MLQCFVFLLIFEIVFFFFAERFHIDLGDDARRVHEFSVHPGVLKLVFCLASICTNHFTWFVA